MKSEKELYHHGIKGQKWGERRFQNEDGSLTQEGRERYSKESSWTVRSRKKHMVSGTLAPIGKKEKASINGKVGNYSVSSNSDISKEPIEYTQDDKDFDDENYDESNRVGDTDFFSFARDDGSVVILEEDMKWVYPPGTNVKEAVKKIEEKLNLSRKKKKSSKYLAHHGILGQKWGVRRYQNPDGTLTEAGKKRLAKKDVKWAKKNYDKIYKDVYKKSRKELNDYVENDLNKRLDMYTYDKNNRKRLSLTYVNDFNRKLSEIMTKNASDYKTPSGRAVKYIAKRGEVGAHMIISDQDFNIQTLKNGVYASGRIAYKKDEVNKA